MPESKKPFEEMLENEPDMIRRIAMIDFTMSAMQDPEEALLSHNVPDGAYEQWANAHYSRLVSIVAQEMNADPEQIADKDRRTPEQEHALLERAGREQIARLQAVLHSNYHAAIGAINNYCMEQTEKDIYEPLRNEYMPDALQKGELVNAPLVAVLYYFATHTDIDPRARDSLTEANKTEIIAIFKRTDAFYMAHRDTLHSEQELARAFIDAESPNPNTARETLEQLKRFKQIDISKIVLPLDKVNSTIWNLGMETTDEIPIRVERNGSKKQLDIMYSVSFDELEDAQISRVLDPYDERIYDVVGALYDAGNNVFTLTQIFKNMGYSKNAKPSAEMIARIRKSIDKMMSAKINVNNEQEAASYKGYDRFVYHGVLLPCEYVDGITQGQVVDSAIHLFREPPMLTFAKGRKQVSIIETRLLQSPINKTAENMRIENYLLKRISRAKTRKQPSKILLKTLYEHAFIKTSKQRTRAIDKIKTYLDWYKECGFISDYTLAQDGICVRFEQSKMIGEK